MMAKTNIFCGDKNNRIATPLKVGKSRGKGIFDDSKDTYGIMTEELVNGEIRIDEADAIQIHE